MRAPFAGQNLAASVKDAFMETISKETDSETIEIAPREASSTLPPVEMRPASPPPHSVAVSPKKPKTTSNLQKDAASPTSAAPAVRAWCDWKTFGGPDHSVLINEIAWMGAEDNAEGEWLELKNVAGMDVDIRGYELLSKNGKIKILLNEKSLRAGDFYVLSRQKLEDVHADQAYAGALSNSGEWLKLFNRDCRLVDELDARHGWPEGSAVKHLTLERKVGSDGWQASLAPGGSPGAQNNVPSFISLAQTENKSVPEENAPSISLTKLPLIASVKITGTASDDDAIKIWNPNTEALDISGWKLRKRTKSGGEYSVKTLLTGSEIAGGGYFLWANSKHPEGADATSTQTLAGDNSVALFDTEDKIADAVAWGSGHSTPYIEGSAYPVNPKAGEILMRKSLGAGYADTNNNAADFELKASN